MWVLCAVAGMHSRFFSSPKTERIHDHSVDWTVQQLWTTFRLKTRWNQPNARDISSTAHVKTLQSVESVWFCELLCTLFLKTFKLQISLYYAMNWWARYAGFACNLSDAAVSLWAVFLTLHQVGDFINVVIGTNSTVGETSAWSAFNHAKPVDLR